MTTAVANSVDLPVPSIAEFFAEPIDDLNSNLHALLDEIIESGNEEEAQQVLTTLHAAIVDARGGLEKSRLEREVAAESAALTEAQNALIAKKQRLAQLSPPAPKKARKARRTKAEIEADAAKAAE